MVERLSGVGKVFSGKNIKNNQRNARAPACRGHTAAVLAEVVDDFAGGVRAGRAREAAAGMRAGAAEKKAANGRAVARPFEQRAHGEKLVEREFTVENVAAGEAVGLLEVERRGGLRGEHKLREIRRIVGERA